MLRATVHTDHAHCCVAALLRLHRCSTNPLWNTLIATFFLGETIKVRVFMQYSLVYIVIYVHS
jgi:hypothetical protein